MVNIKKCGEFDRKFRDRMVFDRDEQGEDKEGTKKPPLD